MRLMSLHMMSEVRRTDDSKTQSESSAKPARSEAMSADRSAWGGWRRNVWKFKFVNQGDLFWCQNEQSRSQSPRSSDEAGNDRGAKGDRKVKGVKDTPTQLNLPRVPRAKQGREVAPQWAWTEASVWTERMLATLERGIKGDKWYSLIDKVWKMENLQRAVANVVRNKSQQKPDGQRCRRYAEQKDWRLPALQSKLRTGEYQPQPVRRVWIPKLGSRELRPLGIPPVENRVVEMAVRQVIEPIFEQTFAEQSYGFRPRRGAKDALRRVQQLLNAGLIWIVDADVKGYYDNIPQDKLLAAVAEHISDGAVFELLRRFLEQGVMESGKGWQPTETGTPQGAVISPLLANIYLNALDHLMDKQGWEMVRYADDFIILCDSAEQAQTALTLVRQ